MFQIPFPFRPNLLKKKKVIATIKFNTKFIIKLKLHLVPNLILNKKKLFSKPNLINKGTSCPKQKSKP